MASWCKSFTWVNPRGWGDSLEGDVIPLNCRYGCNGLHGQHRVCFNAQMCVFMLGDCFSRKWGVYPGGGVYCLNIPNTPQYAYSHPRHFYKRLNKMFVPYNCDFPSLKSYQNLVFWWKTQFYGSLCSFSASILFHFLHVRDDLDHH